MKTTLTDLKTRRSCRAYLPKQVEREDLLSILEAATYSPTGMGKMAATMVVVQDAETIRTISRLNAAVLGREEDPFFGAPTVVVVFADAALSGTYVEDGSLVMGNLMNAAHALGVDSCWIHRARQVFQTQEGRALMAKWGLSENHIGIGNCILGYRAEEPRPAKERRPGYVIWD